MAAAPRRRLAALLVAALVACGAAPSRACPFAAGAEGAAPAARALGGGRALRAAAGGAACTLTVGGVAEAFDACEDVPGYAPEMRLYYSLDGAALRIGLSARTDGYASVGFPARPGKMIGATALVLKPSRDAAGATFGDYYLSAESASGVKQPGRLPVTAVAASADGGVLAGVATVELTDAMLGAAASAPLIFASGRVGSDGSLKEHNREGGAVVDLTAADGAAAGGGSGGGSTDGDGDDDGDDDSGADSDTGGGDNYNSYTDVHGWLMAVGWTLILAGVVTARSFKDAAAPPLWFYLHRGANTVGIVAATVGLIFAVVALEGREREYDAHVGLGAAAMAGGYWQALAWVARPAPGPSALRRGWEWGHYFVGRASLACACAATYVAILQIYPEQRGELGTEQPWALILFTAVTGGLVAVALAKDARDVLRGRRSVASLLVPVPKTPPKLEDPSVALEEQQLAERGTPNSSGKAFGDRPHDHEG